MNQRLGNNQLSRLLHSQLYERMAKFCEQYTPEFPAEPVITSWLNRLFAGDTSLHIFVSLDANYRITGHNIIEVQNIYGRNVVWCHQAQADKDSTGSVGEAMEYMDKLAEEVSAQCCVFVVTKHAKALEKKYGYSTTRSILVKYGEPDEDQ